MKPTAFKVVAAIALIGGALALLIALYWPTFGQGQFMGQKDTYYAQMAAACDELIKGTGPMPREIREDSRQMLPAIIRELKPYRVIVQTNCVIVRVGAGLGGYRIFWCPDDTDITVWQLKIAAGDSRSRRILFSRRSNKDQLK
ncbi:MAG: hypothetical protein ACLQU3_25405 [Limisphaerales bacterium]